MYSLLKRFLTSVLSVGGGVGSSYLIWYLVTPKTIHQKLVWHGYEPLDLDNEEDWKNKKIPGKSKEEHKTHCKNLYEKKVSEDTGEHWNRAINFCVKKPLDREE